MLPQASENAVAGRIGRYLPIPGLEYFLYLFLRR